MLGFVFKSDFFFFLKKFYSFVHRSVVSLDMTPD